MEKLKGIWGGKSKSGRVHWYVRRKGLPLAPMPDLPHDAPEFLAAYASAWNVPAPPAMPRKPKTPPDYRKVFVRLLSKSKTRALECGLAFDLTIDGLNTLVELQRDRCALSGFKFLLNEERGKGRRAFLPSIDRIDCAKGYTFGNVRLVLVAVNIGLADFGDETYLRICRAVAANNAKP